MCALGRMNETEMSILCGSVLSTQTATTLVKYGLIGSSLKNGGGGRREGIYVNLKLPN